jgi:lysozyme
MLHRVTIPLAVMIGGVAVALSPAPVPGVGATVTKAVSEPVRGLDISSYQHAGAPIDWAKLVTQGIRFVAIKASEGTYYLNPYYAADARSAAAAGLRVMPYAFANPSRAGGAVTANYTAGAIGPQRGPGRLPLVVDLENDPYDKTTDCYGLGVPAMIAWISAFTGRTRALTGQWPIIYTTADWWRECTGPAGRFPHDPLWLAAFGGTAPTVPEPWQSWTFWQYDNAATLAGIGQTDLDYYQPTDGLPALRAPGQAKRHAAKPKRHQKVKVKNKSKSKKQAKGKGKRRPKPDKGHHQSVSSSYRGMGGR